MKRRYLFFMTLFGIIAVIYSCKKDNSKIYTRADIIGNWLFEKKSVDTIYIDEAIKIDTTVIYEDRFFIINNSDTSYIKDLEGNQVSANIIYFQSPDSLFYDACPINVFCITSAIISFKIIELNSNIMILRTEQKISNNKKIKEIYYYEK
jgi:hypothetical protein